MSKIIYKNYTEEEALDLIKKRYENMKGRFPFTLARLEENVGFQKIFKRMKEKSYPDWAIYMALVNLIINYKINHSEDRQTSPEVQFTQWKEYMNRIETKDDLLVPVEEFTEDNLEFAIDLYIMSFLKGQGYELRRSTPNVKKLRMFAENNYKMFSFDLPHDKWFKFEKNT